MGAEYVVKMTCDYCGVVKEYWTKAREVDPRLKTDGWVKPEDGKIYCSVLCCAKAMVIPFMKENGEQN